MTVAENQDTKQTSKSDTKPSGTKRDEHEKRVAAARKAARTRRRNEREEAQDPTERTKPVGSKPTTGTAKTEDVSARTAGLAVEKSGPDQPPVDPDVRTSPEAEAQSAQQESAKKVAKEIAKQDDVTDQRKRAELEAVRVQESRSQDHQVGTAPNMDKLAEANREEQMRTAAEWAAPSRGQSASAVEAMDGEIKLFATGGHVFIDTDGEQVLTPDQAIDLSKKLNAAWLAVG